MKKASTISRYLLGLVYVLAGIVGLLNLAPPPKDLPADMVTFMTGMMAAKYFFPLVKLTETICGVFLITSVAPALMLLILAPVTLNIFLFNAFLTNEIGNLIVPVILIILHALASINYWHVFAPLLKRNKV